MRESDNVFRLLQNVLRKTKNVPPHMLHISYTPNNVINLNFTHKTASHVYVYIPSNICSYIEVEWQYTEEYEIIKKKKTVCHTHRPIKALDVIKIEICI